MLFRVGLNYLFLRYVFHLFGILCIKLNTPLVVWGRNNMIRTYDQWFYMQLRKPSNQESRINVHEPGIGFFNLVQASLFRGTDKYCN